MGHLLWILKDFNSWIPNELDQKLFKIGELLLR